MNLNKSKHEDSQGGLGAEREGSNYILLSKIKERIEKKALDWDGFSVCFI